MRRAAFSAPQVIAEVSRRIDAAGDPGIFLHLVARERLEAWAEDLGSYDPGRPLWGIPFAVKDNIDVAGCPTTAGCPAYAYVAEADAAVVARLRAAGALPVGKTNLDQFATGLVGIRTPHPVPLNALDPAIVPGGSSSGSAVAVARGIVAFALGTDTAGSGRVPAALNNIVGLKPSLGAISTRGVVPACRTLDAVSIFALTVDDAYAVFREAAGFDPEDPYSRPVAAGPLGEAPPHPTIGIPSRASAALLRRRGAGARLRRRLRRARRRSARGCGRSTSSRSTPSRTCSTRAPGWPSGMRWSEELLARDPEALLPVTAQIIGRATGLSATDAFRGFYRLEALRRQVAPVLASVDLLCVPSIPTFYSLDDLARDPVLPNTRLGTYTNFVNLLGLCGLTVPTLPREDGRPGSVTLLAESGRDGVLAALGRRIERRGGPHARRHRLAGAAARRRSPPTAGPDELELAVCGAHMSGLPLNGELTRLGARFLRSARTIAGVPALQPSRRAAASAGSGAQPRRRRGRDPRRGLGAAADAARRLRGRHPGAALHRHGGAGRRNGAEGLSLRALRRRRRRRRQRRRRLAPGRPGGGAVTGIGSGHEALRGPSAMRQPPGGSQPDLRLRAAPAASRCGRYSAVATPTSGPSATMSTRSSSRATSDASRPRRNAAICSMP